MARRVIVCGSRRWRDRAAIEARLYEIGIRFSGEEVTIVHGNAQGADRIAAQEAGKAGMLIERHDAQWGVYGKAAGHIRNAHMASLGADLCIAFWDGQSKGTAGMIDQAKKAGIPVVVVRETL